MAASAGIQPRGYVQPRVLAILAALGYPTADLHSKSWRVFATSGAPVFHHLISLCDEESWPHEHCQAARSREVETPWRKPDVSLCRQALRGDCSAWPGRPTTDVWRIADPMAPHPPGALMDMILAETVRDLRERIETLIDNSP